MNLSNNQQAFLELVKAGLWEKDTCLKPYGDIDIQEVYRLSQDQSVVGLVAAGLEHLSDMRPPKEDVLTFAGEALQLEQRNTAMNSFIGVLVEKMRGKDIYSLLVKGQGISQCYERPSWRACGDVDLLLSEGNYNKAKALLTPLASSVGEEVEYIKHLDLIIDPWEVELHGNLYTGLFKRIDKGIEQVQSEVFNGGDVRSWMNGSTQVCLPGPDSDVIFVFTHILQHYFKEGVGLRQLCDWCRLLYTYREKINLPKLKAHLNTLGILTEWQAFASLVVNFLGMPQDSMPFYSHNLFVKKKGTLILKRILALGNMGHKRTAHNEGNSSVIKRKAKTFCRVTSDTLYNFFIFPVDSIRIWWNTIRVSLMGAVTKNK